MKEEVDGNQCHKLKEFTNSPNTICKQDVSFETFLTLKFEMKQ